MKSSKPEDDSC